MGDTLDYLESNAYEGDNLGGEDAGFPTHRHIEYKPNRMMVTSRGYPSNRATMHYDIGNGKPACFSKNHETYKWRMTGRRRNVTCKHCVDLIGKMFMLFFADCFGQPDMMKLQVKIREMLMPILDEELKENQRALKYKKAM
jgi:hypothetical protein